MHAALERAHAKPEDALLVGDTPYDLAAAQRAGVAFVGVRSGGWDDAALRGAIAIYLRDWRVGLDVLFFLSLLHVLLEFPLNHQSFVGIARELRSVASPPFTRPSRIRPG